jgi:type IV secretory pathway VirB10-like protein
VDPLASEKTAALERVLRGTCTRAGSPLNADEARVKEEDREREREREREGEREREKKRVSERKRGRESAREKERQSRRQLRATGEIRGRRVRRACTRSADRDSPERGSDCECTHADWIPWLFY